MYAGHENVPLACCVPTSRRRHLILGDASGWGKAFAYRVLRVYSTLCFVCRPLRRDVLFCFLSEVQNTNGDGREVAETCSREAIQ